MSSVDAATAKAPYAPLCIPVAWRTDEASWLAYHHGWSDERFYNVVHIASSKKHVHDGDYIATVDDFGNLVPIADVSEWGFLHPRWPLWIHHGREVH